MIGHIITKLSQLLIIVVVILASPIIFYAMIKEEIEFRKTNK